MSRRSSDSSSVVPWRHGNANNPPRASEGVSNCGKRIPLQALAVLSVVCVSSLLVQHRLLPNLDVFFLDEEKEALPPEDDQPEFLPLLPWEAESAANRTCRPPSEEFPELCCPGSASRGGALFYDPKLCSDPSIYDRVKNHTLDYMEKKRAASNTRHDDRPRRHKNLDSGRLCDACQIVDHLLTHNLTLTFQGDSMTKQTFSGLECELRRRGYGVRARTIPWEKRKKDTFWRYGIISFSELSVSLPHAENRTQQQQEDAASDEAVARIQMYFVYRPLEDNEEIAEIVDNSDIVVFDHGLHWGAGPLEKKEYLNATAVLLRAYRSGNLRLLAWRETSAQHYNRTGGDFFKGAGSCVPMREGREGWRLPAVRLASERAGFKVRNALDPGFMMDHPVGDDNNNTRELVILPFREYTSELHYLHPEECAHYCSTPYVWLPIWRGLRLAMDRALLRD